MCRTDALKTAIGLAKPAAIRPSRPPDRRRWHALVLRQRGEALEAGWIAQHRHFLLPRQHRVDVASVAQSSSFASATTRATSTSPRLRAALPEAARDAPPSARDRRTAA